ARSCRQPEIDQVARAFSLPSACARSRLSWSHVLRLWPRMAELTLSTKYVTVEARNPPASARGNIEITDSVLDMWRDSVPINLRLFIEYICRVSLAVTLV